MASTGSFWDRAVDVQLRRAGDTWTAIFNSATQSFSGVFTQNNVVETDNSGQQVLLADSGLLVNTATVAKYLVYGSVVTRDIDGAAWVVRDKLKEQDGSTTRLVITTGSVE